LNQGQVQFLTCFFAVAIVRESGFCAYLCVNSFTAPGCAYKRLEVSGESGWDARLALATDYNARVVGVCPRHCLPSGRGGFLQRKSFFEVMVATA
jgi:hypothetical protein